MRAPEENKAMDGNWGFRVSCPVVPGIHTWFSCEIAMFMDACWVFPDAAIMLVRLCQESGRSNFHTCANASYKSYAYLYEGHVYLAVHRSSKSRDFHVIA